MKIYYLFFTFAVLLLVNEIFSTNMNLNKHRKKKRQGQNVQSNNNDNQEPYDPEKISNEIENKINNSVKIEDENENNIFKTKTQLKLSCHDNQMKNCEIHCKDRFGIFNCILNAKVTYISQGIERKATKPVLCICNENKYRYKFKVPADKI